MAHPWKWRKTYCGRMGPPTHPLHAMRVESRRDRVVSSRILVLDGQGKAGAEISSMCVQMSCDLLSKAAVGWLAGVGV
jgi:hypothetical protein